MVTLIWIKPSLDSLVHLSILSIMFSFIDLIAPMTDNISRKGSELVKVNHFEKKNAKIKKNTVYTIRSSKKEINPRTTTYLKLTPYFA